MKGSCLDPHWGFVASSGFRVLRDQYIKGVVKFFMVAWLCDSINIFWPIGMRQGDIIISLILNPITLNRIISYSDPYSTPPARDFRLCGSLVYDSFKVKRIPTLLEVQNCAGVNSN